MSAEKIHCRVGASGRARPAPSRAMANAGFPKSMTGWPTSNFGADRFLKCKLGGLRRRAAQFLLPSRRLERQFYQCTGPEDSSVAAGQRTTEARK